MLEDCRQPAKRLQGENTRGAWGILIVVPFQLRGVPSEGADLRLFLKTLKSHLVQPQTEQVVFPPGANQAEAKRRLSEC